MYPVHLSESEELRLDPFISRQSDAFECTIIYIRELKTVPYRRNDINFFI